MFQEAKFYVYGSQSCLAVKRYNKLLYLEDSYALYLFYLTIYCVNNYLFRR